MLTVKDFNRITFLHHRGIVPPSPAKEGETAVEKRFVCTANMKLLEYGYVMAYDLFEACCKATHTAFLEVWSELYGFITEDSKAISKTSPIWPNFPNDAMNASLVELYIVNYLNYLSGGTWTPDSDPSRFCKGLDKDHLPVAKQIPACTEDEIYRYLVQSVTGKAPLSPDEQNTVKMLLSDSGEEFLDKVMSLMKDKDIPCKENLALYVSYIIHRPDWKSQKCFLNFKSATDVLRLAAAMSGQDVSLAKAPRFRSFTRAERRELLGLLEHVEKDEGFALRPEQFKRLGEKLHPSEYAKYFPENKAIFDKVRNGIKIETYNSKLQELMKPPVNAELLTAHLMLRPGMFARYLDFALRSCKDTTAMEDVLFRFISVCKSVEPRVLVQLINHFRNRNNPVQLATGKANGAASKVLDREVEPIPEDICNRVARDIFNQLWQVLRAEDTEPKCAYLDPACHCNDIVFPDNPRQISSSLRSAACGSRTPGSRRAMCFVRSSTGKRVSRLRHGTALTWTSRSRSMAMRRSTSSFTGIRRLSRSVLSIPVTAGAAARTVLSSMWISISRNACKTVSAMPQ